MRKYLLVYKHWWMVKVRHDVYYEFNDMHYIITCTIDSLCCFAQIHIYSRVIYILSTLDRFCRIYILFWPNIEFGRIICILLHKTDLSRQFLPCPRMKPDDWNRPVEKCRPTTRRNFVSTTNWLYLQLLISAVNNGRYQNGPLLILKITILVLG